MSEKELLENGYRIYKGDEINIFFNLSMCTHATECVCQLPEVFNVNRTPWIIANNASKEAVKQTIDCCPSGALQYIEKENESNE